LGRWLDRLVAQKLDTKLRILLLDREAPEAFGWWRELTGSGLNTARERRGLFYAARPRELPDLSDLEERRHLMLRHCRVPAISARYPPMTRKFHQRARTRNSTGLSPNLSSVIL
jgi:hypothetical protein